MESTPDDREHGYDNELEEEAYEAAEDPDTGPAGDPEPEQPDQAEGE